MASSSSASLRHTVHKHPIDGYGMVVVVSRAREAPRQCDLSARYGALSDAIQNIEIGIEIKGRKEGGVLGWPSVVGLGWNGVKGP